MALKYKVGDYVRIKSLDWYNKNKDNYGAIYAGNGFCFWKNMVRHCGEIMKITSVKVDPEDSNKGYYFMENSDEKWTDGMIEGLVEEETKPKFKVGDEVRIKGTDIGGTIESVIRGQLIVNSKGSKIPAWPEDVVLMKSVKDETALNRWTGLKVELELSKNVIGVSNVESLRGERFMSGFVKAIIPPDGYIFKDENGNIINTQKIVLEKKKKEYPKTYEECCEIVKVGKEHTLEGATIRINYKIALLESFQKLLICRDAYWKIAGEKRGLKKPWELSIGTPIYYIYYNRTVGTIKNGYADDIQGNIILAFSTKEMRDIFYENFKELIEECKELL